MANPESSDKGRARTTILSIEVKHSPIEEAVRKLPLPACTVLPDEKSNFCPGSFKRTVAALCPENLKSRCPTKNTLQDRHDGFGIIGRSDAIRDVRRQIEIFGPTDITVMIGGESGAGKELVARALHRISPRSKKPFVSLNCGALPDTLIDSELFGHVRGAFTGAMNNRAGVFETANGGTICLDEIGEMSLWAQVKLLRVLQEKEIIRLGESIARKVDCRVIAATNKDIEQAVRDRSLREDLWYRLNAVTIHVPPLRERAEDIPLLVRHFLEKHSRRAEGKEENASGCGISPETMNVLLRYPFPGNVRELENTVRYALVMAGGQAIAIEHLPPNIRNGFPRKLQPAAGPVGEAELLAELKALTVPGCQKPWCETLRSASIEEIHRFLVERGARWFRRRELAEYLKTCRGTCESKYAASGLYIRVLETHGILEHNGQETSRRRFILSRRFLADRSDATTGLFSGLL